MKKPMKIYTKNGDKGKTRLFGGTEKFKDDIRLECYGTIDELNAHVGHISDHEINSNLKEDLIKVQNLLFNLGSLLANDKNDNLKYLPKITKSHIDFLEKRIDEIEDELSELKNFILPSGNKIFSLTQIARTVCRRAERKLVKLSNDQKNIDLNYVSFLNRLSDYLFVLSRKFLKDFNVKERYWQKDSIKFNIVN